MSRATAFSFRLQLSLLIVVFKMVGLVSAYLLSGSSSLPITAGDTNSYFEPVYNLFKEGRYYLLVGDSPVLAGRMPYYGLLWAIAQRLMGGHSQLVLMVVQIILSTTSFVFLGHALAEKWPSKLQRLLGGLVVLGLALNPAIAFADLCLLPDSLSLSATWLLVAALLLDTHRERLRLTLFAVSAAVLIVLRPHVLVLVGPLALLLVHQLSSAENTMRPRRAAMQLLVLALPTLVILAPWVVRNAVVLHRFIPFQQDLYAGYPDIAQAEYQALKSYMMTWNGRIVWYERGSNGCYFFPMNCRSNGLAAVDRLTSWAYSEAYPAARVDSLRDHFVASYSQAGDDTALATAFTRMGEAIRMESPVQAYALAPAMATFGMLLHPLDYFSFHERQGDLLVMLVYVGEALRWLLVALAVVGLILRPRAALPYLVLSIGLCALFAIALGRAESRNALHAYPLLLAGAHYALAAVIRRQGS